MNAIKCINNTQANNQIVGSKIANSFPELPKHEENKGEKSLKTKNINLEEPTAYQTWNVEQEYKKRRKKEINNYTEDAKLTLVKMSLIYGLQAICKRFKINVYSIEGWRQKFNINITSLADRLNKSNGKNKYSEATKMQLAGISFEEGIDETCKKYEISLKLLKNWRAKFRKINNIAPPTKRRRKKNVKLGKMCEWNKDKESKKEVKRSRNTYLAETRKEVARIANQIGLWEASKRFNISFKSIERWVQEGESPESPPPLKIIPNKRKLPYTFDTYPPALRIVVANEACRIGQRKAGIAFNIQLKALERWVPAYKSLGFDELINTHRLHFRGPGRSIYIKPLGGRGEQCRGDQKPKLEYSSEFSTTSSTTSIVSSEEDTNIKGECSEERTSMKRECSDEGEERAVKEDVYSKVSQILNSGLHKANMEIEGKGMGLN